MAARARLPDRGVLVGSIFVLRTGTPWELLPPEMGCGSGMTCWRRLRDWYEAGVWDLLHQVLFQRLYVLEHGCRWRGLPRHFGPWHTVYMRLSRWSKAGVIERVFAQLQNEQMLTVRIEAVGLDSTSSKVHPDGTGARKKTDRKPSDEAVASARPSFIWSPRLIAVS